MHPAESGPPTVSQLKKLFFLISQVKKNLCMPGLELERIQRLTIF
jgi:hypothetical protein